MSETQQIDFCTLCQADLTQHPILDGPHAFCCLGCHAVYNILSTKNQLSGATEHPIFMQALKSGLISNPALLEQIQKQRAETPETEREKFYLEIGEMWCPSCAEIIKLMLSRERGVINCLVDYATDLAAIEYAPRMISREKIESIVKQLGYQPITLDISNRKPVSLDLYLRFGVAAFCALNIMMLAYPLYATYFSYDGEGYGPLFAWLSLAASIPVLTYSAWPIWKRFWNSLKVGLFGMETLVAIGVAAATALSVHELFSGGTNVYFDSMTVIIVFVLLGKIVEARAKFSAKESLLRLTKSTPRRGRKRFFDGSVKFVPVKEIQKGDIIIAYQGEKITLDGIVNAGQGTCDESLLTGEAIPVIKQNGSGVLGGAILVQGHLEYRVTCGPEESALQKIIQMVESDIGHKTAYVRAADTIVRWFVPAVITVAALTGIFYWLFPSSVDTTPSETAWLRALAVLLISCPCAIGIAAPAAESYLLNGLASLGALVRNRGCLRHLGRETTLIFDKTGTVTEGSFAVYRGLERLSEEDRRALGSLAQHSTHPVACAISRAISGENFAVKNLEELTGHGLKGIIEGSLYCLGSAKFMERQGIFLPECKEKPERLTTKTYFAKEGVYLTHLYLADKIRPEIPDLLTALKPVRTVLLSGDAEETVSQVAQQCGFDEWKSLCSPLEKRNFIENLRKQGEVVCMLGDGINDAPALTMAHIGISVISAADMSIQVSDILLTTEKLSVLLKLRHLAMRGQKIVRQNLFWAFFYNVIGVGLAAAGILSPIFAAFAMSISSVTVLFNARRLHRETD